MLTAKSSCFKLSTITLTFVVLAAIGLPARGQDAPAISVGSLQVKGIPDDWSHRHLVFTNPGTEKDAIRSGKHEEWLRVVNDPRYIIHQLKHGLPAQGPAAADVAFRESTVASIKSATLTPQLSLPSVRFKRKMPGITKDWTMSLAGSTTTAAMAPNAYPAKFSFFDNNTANCADYVVFPTGLAGTSTQATIVGYNDLYLTTCSANPPALSWAYNTGGTSNLSPVVSLGGDEIAYIQTVSSVASLVLLKPKAGTGGTIATPTTPTSVTNLNYRACTAPCYTTLLLSGTTPDDTNSAPFVDYLNNFIYVGDNNGALHKFQNVFSTGTPGEITGGVAGVSGWPQTMVAAVTLTSPVYDAVSGNVFVSSNGGILYRIGSAGGAHVASGQIAVATGADFVDGPLVDSQPATPLVYVFVGDASSVHQLSATFTAATTGIAETLGSSAATTLQYAGTFDNLHYSIAGGTAGNLYVCGYHSTGTVPRLYIVPMNATFTGTVANTTTDPASTAGTCSPVAEYLGSKANTTLSAAITNVATAIPVTSGTGITNTTDYIQVDSEIMHVTAGGGTGTLTVARAQFGTAGAAHSSGAAVQDIQDWIYLSVTAGGGATGCTGACLYNYSVTTGTAPANATAGIAATGGTSGVIVDNFSTATGASQIYYTTLGAATCTGNTTTGSSGTHGCAVQASQSAP